MGHPVIRYQRRRYKTPYTLVYDNVREAEASSFRHILDPRPFTAASLRELPSEKHQLCPGNAHHIKRKALGLARTKVASGLRSCTDIIHFVVSSVKGPFTMWINESDKRCTVADAG